jgi:nucleotide-binding universal stress UspA family protein
MYKKVLLPIDLAEESSWRKALPTAVECCQAFGAELHLMTVVPDFGMSAVAQYFPEDYAERAGAEAAERLKKLSAEQVSDGIKVHHRVGHGTIYEEILKATEETGCDLIVMASQRPELKDYLLGPNAARVVRHANCSVLVVRD